MPVSASPCIQYNTEKKNVKEVITAMSGIGIARKPQYRFPVCFPWRKFIPVCHALTS